MSSSPDLPREEFEATLAARQELGKELEPALVDSFVDKVEAAIAAREAANQHASAAAVQRRNSESSRATAVAIVSAGVAIPLTAIGGGMAGFLGMLLVWIGLVCINLAFAMGRRRDQ